MAVTTLSLQNGLVRSFAHLLAEGSLAKITDIIHTIMHNNPAIDGKVVIFVYFHVIDRLFPAFLDASYPKIIDSRTGANNSAAQNIC